MKIRKLNKRQSKYGYHRVLRKEIWASLRRDWGKRNEELFQKCVDELAFLTWADPRSIAPYVLMAAT